MSIVINLLGEERGQATWALVSHGKNTFNALIDGRKSKLMPLLNQEQLTEMSFESVVRWRDLPGFRDEESGMEAARGTDEAVTLKGRVHSVVEVGENSKVLLMSIFKQDLNFWLCLLSSWGIKSRKLVSASRSLFEVFVFTRQLYSCVARSEPKSAVFVDTRGRFAR